jgi:hypothetical protein
MPRYLVLSLGGTPPRSAADRKALMARWRKWFETHAAHVVDAGAPLGARASLNGSESGATGFMVVEADNLEEATALVRGSPANDGTHLEVLEIQAM